MRSNLQIGLGLIVVLIMLGIALLGPFIYTPNPLAQDLNHALEGPSHNHPWGTDELGRDLLSRVIHGLGATLFISLAGVLAGSLAGIVLGLSSGYFGGWWDQVAMRCTEMLLAMPGFLLALVVAALFKANHLNLILAVAVFTLPGFARLIRSRVLEIREREYVTAAKALGGRDWQILFQHILPNSMPLIYTLLTQRLSAALLTASGLSFLGLGPQPPAPELGAMLNTGREYLWIAPQLSTLPGIVISLTIIGFNLLGYGLQEAARKRR